MKVWRFYKKPESDIGTTNVDIGIKYPLYALTNKKKLANAFKNTRNMDMFIMKVTDEDKEDYSIFANRNRSTVLGEYDLKTVINKYEEDEKFVTVPFVITEGEEQVLEEPYLEIDQYDFWVTAPDPKLFKGKLAKALEALEYMVRFKLMTQQTYDDIIDDDDYSAPSCDVDELAYFINVYGKTLK